MELGFGGSGSRRWWESELVGVRGFGHVADCVGLKEYKISGVLLSMENGTKAVGK